MGTAAGDDLINVREGNTCSGFKSLLTFVFLHSSKRPDVFLGSVSNEDDGEVERQR